jgi:hypothetical protein
MAQDYEGIIYYYNNSLAIVAEQNNQIFSPSINTEANIESGGFQIGEATVGSGANADSDCKNYVGKTATGRYDSCDHQGCTEAKNRATANLHLGVVNECRMYISSTKPCKKYHCN